MGGGWNQEAVYSSDQLLRAGDFLPVKRVGPGESAQWENLDQGSYVIEELTGPQGFSVYVGQRVVQVPSGQEGQVHINGNYGKLTITAPGSQGSGEQYYYMIASQGGGADAYNRTVGPVNAGEQYQVEHLPKGTYGVKEYNYTGSSGFSITVPQVSPSTRTITHTKTGNPKINTWYSYSGVPEDVLYAKIKFDKIQGVTAGSKMYLGIAGTWSDSPDEEKGWKYSGTAGQVNYINNRYLLPGSRILLKRYDDNITSIRVVFTYYREKPSTTTCSYSDTSYTKTVGTDWMEIKKNPDSATPDGEVYYYYTILDKDDQPITGYTVQKNGAAVTGSDVTDREGTAVKLKAGDTVRLEGLKAGSYKIMETIDQDTPSAFQLAVEETESTTSQAPVDVEILGPRTVTITKDDYGTEDDRLDFTYTFQVKDQYGNPVGDQVELAPGESTVLPLPESGKYQVVQAERNDVFNLSYTDSGTVGAMTTSTGWKRGRSRAGDASAGSVVTFTNHFSREEGSYKVIHEYYFRERDGSYTCEGSTAMSSEGGLKVDSGPYTDAHVITRNIFDGNPYRYFQTAYGTVSSEDSLALAYMATGSNWDSQASGTGEEPEKDAAQPGQSPDQDTARPDQSPEKATPSDAGKEPPSNGSTPVIQVATPSEYSRAQQKAGKTRNSKTEDGETGDGETEDDEAGDDQDVVLIDDRATGSDWRTRGSDSDLLDDQASPSNAVSRLADDGIMALPENEGIDEGKSQFDDSGIISQGVLLYNGKECSYEPEAGKDYVTATKEGEQVIILRYYREIPRGSYKVLHVYYLRDEYGDIREGTSQILTEGPVELTDEERVKLHTVESVPQQPHPSVYYSQKGAAVECAYEYAYDGCAYGKVVPGGIETHDYYVFGSTYQPDDGMKGVYSTEPGDQIIILRYVRTPGGPITPTGSYKVVHEYYYRKAVDSGQSGAVQDSPGEDGERPAGRSGVVLDGGTAGGWPAVPLDGEASGGQPGVARDGEASGGQPGVSPDGQSSGGESADIPHEDGSGEDTQFHGTLIGDKNYSYTFEGMTSIETIAAPLGQEVHAEEIQQRLEHAPDGTKSYHYAYHNSGYGETTDGGIYEWIPSKEWAASTEDGDQIIILRYVRTGTDEPTPPEKPDRPTPPGGGGGGGGGGGDSTPPPAPNPPAPEPPADPESPQGPGGLPDPNDPNSPDTITVWEDGVPKTYIKVWDPEIEEYVYLLDQEIPLEWLDLPKTGDRSSNPLWTVLLFSAAAGILGIVAVRQKEHKE